MSRPLPPELTDEQVAEYRRRLADPDYMAHAIYCMADKVIHDMRSGDGTDEPHFQDTGRVGPFKAEGK